jgi:predicted transcriptional regulator
MTPGEFRKITAGDKLTKLAAMDNEMLDIALSVFEAREAPVIMTGQYGSSSAGDVMEFGKELAKRKDLNEYKKLRGEIAKDFKKLAGKKLVEADEEGGDPDHVEHSHEMKKHMESGPKEAPVSPGSDEHSVSDQAGDEKQLAHHMSALAHHLESGDIEAAKKSHAEMSMCMKHGMKHMSEYSGDVKSEDYKDSMSQMQSQVDEIKTQMARMAGMVDEMMGAEKEEGEHFGEISNEHEEMNS